MNAPEAASNVPADYVHHAKRSVAHAPLMAGGAHLKWYDIEREGAPVPRDIRKTARAFVTAAATDLPLEGDCGFVILHRCGDDFYFLLLSVWRGANELWEAVYYTDPAIKGFAPFPAANPGEGSPLRPTFCVWELGVVTHEAKAWQRFLSSRRNPEALTRWKSAHFENVV